MALFLFIGLATGGAGFDLIPADLQAWYNMSLVIVLTMVAFLLGGGLNRETLRQHGRAIIAIFVGNLVGDAWHGQFGADGVGFAVRSFQTQCQSSQLGPSWTAQCLAHASANEWLASDCLAIPLFQRMMPAIC